MCRKNSSNGSGELGIAFASLLETETRLYSILIPLVTLQRGCHAIKAACPTHSVVEFRASRFEEGRQAGWDAPALRFVMLTESLFA
jgi:hypothetical protein